MWAGETRSPAPGNGRGHDIVLIEFPPSGGLFQFAVQLGEGLARRGHRVELLTGPRPELNSRVPGMIIESRLPTWHPTAGAGKPDWWRRVRRAGRAARHLAAWLVTLAWLRRNQPDVVLWSAWRFPIDGWGVQVARRLLPGSTLGLIAHEPRPLVEQAGPDGHYKTDPVLRRALAGAYRVLDVAYTLGERSRDVLRANWPIDAPVRVVPHGDEGVFVAAEPPPVADTDRRVLCFGTLTRYKGVDELLAVWPRVRAAVPDARLVLAGHLGADLDADALRRTVAGTAGAELHAGYVPMDQVPDLFGAARVVALPYRRGSQSGVAHLAYAFGRPVVATAVGDLPDVVRPGETGILVPEGDPEALVAALTRLLCDPGEAERLGRAGRERLARSAGWDEVAAAVCAGLPARPEARPESLRVLHVLDSFSFGGAENLVADLGRHPDGQDWELRAASLGPAGRGRDALLDRLTDAGLRPVHLGVRRLIDPIGFVRLVRALRKLRPDVVHAHLGYSATLLPPAARLAGIGCVATLHHLPSELRPVERLKERLSVRIPARLGALVLLSRPVLEAFADRHGPATHRWRLVPNGVDLTRFATARPAPDLPRDGTPTWAVLAALREPKGHLDLLRAWRRVKDAGRPARLLIVGDGDFRPAIEAELERLDLADRVVLLGRRDDVPAVLAAVDGVVSASHSEALPTALIEAAAAGLPVVCTAAGGSTDVVTAATGWLTPVGDPDALADALLDALDHPEEATLRGKRGREHVEHVYGRPAWTARLDHLYRSVLRPPARRRLRRAAQVGGLR
ncbi:glycosyltransferase family 4 protein [Microlunatus sp. GCM10028923]|uniref:glycosyltransferase family 4 protein n=1 Tax=Microlunatus sp. GCM10028923 TaxID=3273400 RepID=UPI00360B852F